ncbi:hypothetical protein SAMN05414139_01731 [Burkholderia sp. D7]|nr:hypothetical protein SAMN05414139_01731 [Burkholderia sp. D7]
MKPLLRAVLVINALIFLAFGVLFLLTPWAALWASMHLVTVQPPFVGQLFGVALIGLAWLEVHAAIDGALTATVAKVSGHVEWLSGLVMMVWLLGLRTPELTGFGQVIAALAGVVMLVLGLGSVRLSGAVRRHERAALAGAAAAERAEKRAAKTQAEERVERIERVTPPPRPLSSDPVAPANPRWDSELVEPVVGEAIPRSAAPAPSATAFDPATGHAIDPATGRTLDPATGRAFDPVSGHKIDPETGRPIDPVTGRTVDPVTGQFIDPIRRDPR